MLTRGSASGEYQKFDMLDPVPNNGALKYEQK